MSEAIIFAVMHKLENVLAETPSFCVAPFLDQYFKNMTSHKGILEEVIKELRMMSDFLKTKDRRVKNTLKYLLADFAEMAHDSADLTINIDEDFFCKKMANLRDRLRTTKKRMMAFGVGEGASRREEGDEGVVVGLEKDAQQFTGRAILNEKPGLVASCIKGMAGVGKTTLARRVYAHSAVVSKLKPRAWLSLSSHASANEVLVELMRQVLEQMDYRSFQQALCHIRGWPDFFIGLRREMDNRSLQDMLHQILQGMPYFIVLDNMPKEMQLISILRGLPTGGHGCRLLLTSRYRITEDLFYTHEMKVMDSDKSWQLFLKTIDKFTSDENKFSKELERKGRKMLKKCGGLPIAIIDVGKQKARQRLLGFEWEELFDSVDLSESLKLLEPMYHELEEELKPCFLYMSFFKENAIMREKKLEHIWALRGINTQRATPHMVGGSTCYVSRPCTYDLVSESIIEVVHDFRHNTEVKRCRINPLLHMLSIKIAEKELGFEILRSDGSDRPSQSPRHRVVHCRREKHNHSTNQDKCLVSLIFHGGGRCLDETSSSYWKSFELLSILDMEDFGVKTLSETIGTLIELRYLGLRNNYIQEIPHSLEGLKKLEVLDIALNFMVEVPDIINEIDSLRHLYMSDVIYRKPLKVDALQNLETLTYVSIYDWTYEVSSLEKMTYLRELGIEEIDEDSDTSKLIASLAMSKSFLRLNLRGFRFKSMPCLDDIGVIDRLSKLRLDGRLARLPSALSFLRHLSYLVLVNTCLDEDPMQVLQEMPELNVVKLRNAYTGRQMVVDNGGFFRLRVLRIDELWNLRDVRVGKRGMWLLHELEIKNCPLLETLPQEIGSMSDLRKLKMVTTKHIATKIKNLKLISRIVEVDISP